MSDLLEHRGYSGSVGYSRGSGRLEGRVQFVRARIEYAGESLAELEEAFRRAVDGYLEACEAAGEKPETPCSGTFNVRIGHELHRELSLYAAERGLSVNAALKEALRGFFGRGRG